VAFAKFYECLEVVLYISVKSGADPVISKDICDYMGVKPRHLEPLMQQLVKHGILKGTKGPKGGYTLAKEKRKLTALDVYKAAICDNGIQCGSGKMLKNKIIVPFSNNLNECMHKKLNVVTIEKLCGNITESGFSNDSSGEFNI